MGNERICVGVTVLTVILLGLISKSQGVAYLSDYKKVFKCCPQGSELKVVANESENFTDYECTLTREDVENNQTFFGYNLDITDDIQIPVCSDVKLIDFDVDEGLISIDGCVDMYNGALHGLSCSENSKLEVRKLFKCCAEGFSYDIINRQCVDNLEASDNFFKLVGKSVAIFQTHVPVCESNEIFVEYQIEINQSESMRSGLKLKNMDEYSTLQPGTFCVDEIVDPQRNASMTNDKHRIIVRSCRPNDLCEDIPCVRRCCRNEMMMKKINGSIKCVEYSRNIKPTFHDMTSPINGLRTGYSVVEPPVYGLINTQDCFKYKLSNDDPDDAHFISHVDGSLHVKTFDGSYSNNEYCVEFVDMGTVDLHTFVCFAPFPQAKFKYYATGLTISCVFLALTLICYACLPKLLNLHGKTLVCHVISMLSACIALAIVQFRTETKMERCYVIGYFIFFGFLAAFCWQSIMCFDIWWTFGSVRTSRGMAKTKELRRFLLYSLYAWGVPTIVTALTVSVDYWQIVPEEFSPQIISRNICWFTADSRRGHLIFFLLPIGLHIFTNAFLFVLTAIHCSKIKSEISRMQCSKDNDAQDKKKKFMADKAKYAMNIKLFTVMGVPWIFEIIATILNKPDELWYVSDAFNILQGVLVFFIFVCKTKVWEAIKQRLGRGRKNKKGPTTVTTQLSVTSNGKLGKSASTTTLSTSSTNLNVIRKVV